MKITDNRPVSGTGNVKKKIKSSSASSTAFADVLSAVGASSDGPGEAKAVSATASVGSLLSLQEVSDEEYARNKTIQHGQNLLQSLEALRQSLLLGTVPISVLQTLESRLKVQREQTVDPKLHSIMDDIELRAAVELAKWQKEKDKFTDNNQY